MTRDHTKETAMACRMTHHGRKTVRGGWVPVCCRSRHHRSSESDGCNLVRSVGSLHSDHCWNQRYLVCCKTHCRTLRDFQSIAALIVHLPMSIHAELSRWVDGAHSSVASKTRCSACSQTRSVEKHWTVRHRSPALLTFRSFLRHSEASGLTGAIPFPVLAYGCCCSAWTDPFHDSEDCSSAAACLHCPLSAAACRCSCC